MLEHMMKLYSYGYDIDAISYDCDCSEDDVMNTLKEFKINNFKNSSSFSPEFLQLISERFKSGVTPYAIETELSMPNASCGKILSKSGLKVVRTYGRQKKDPDYEILNTKDFSTCPCCSSKKVNSLADGCTLDDSRTYDLHSYCLDCFTEWYKDGSKVKKVLFHKI